MATINIKYEGIKSIIYSCKHLEDFNFKKASGLSQGNYSNAIGKMEYLPFFCYVLSCFIHLIYAFTRIALSMNFNTLLAGTSLNSNGFFSVNFIF